MMLWPHQNEAGPTISVPEQGRTTASAGPTSLVPATAVDRLESAVSKAVGKCGASRDA